MTAKNQVIKTLCGSLLMMALPAYSGEYKVSDGDGLWLGLASGAGFIEEKQLLDNTENTESGLMTKLELGYDFNPNFGIYGSYDYFDSTSDNEYLHIGGVGIRGRGYLTDNLSLFVKAGINYLVGGNNENGPVGSIGAGVEYNLTHATSIKAGLDYYNDLEVTNHSLGDLSQLYLGFSYRFGQPETPQVIEKVVTEIKEVEVTRFVEQEKRIDEVNVVNFSNDSSIPLSTDAFDDLLLTLKENNTLNINITGYTDSVGRDEYNLLLSERRASSVADYFIRNGIDAKQISLQGLGKSNPVASNDNEVGRSENRRAEVTLTDCTKAKGC